MKGATDEDILTFWGEAMKLYPDHMDLDNLEHRLEFVADEADCTRADVLTVLETYGLSPTDE